MCSQLHTSRSVPGTGPMQSLLLLSLGDSAAVGKRKMVFICNSVETLVEPVNYFKLQYTYLHSYCHYKICAHTQLHESSTFCSRSTCRSLPFCTCATRSCMSSSWHAPDRIVSSAPVTVSSVSQACRRHNYKYYTKE